MAGYSLRTNATSGAKTKRAGKMQRGVAGNKINIDDEKNTICRSEGGHLASVVSLETQNFLVEEEKVGIWRHNLHDKDKVRETK